METPENINAIQTVPLTDADWAEWSAYVAATFHVRIGETVAVFFKKLLSELKEWNSKMNLVSFRDDRELLYRHFADSLAAVTLIEKLKTVPDPKIADIGAGAGFPGVPVYGATAFKDITLMESITKKTFFLSHLKDVMPLPGMRIINDRVENIARDSAHRGAYDFVLSRAVSKLSPNLEIAVPLLKTGGFAILYKTEASASDVELSAATNALKALNSEISGKFCYTIPGESRNYCVVAFRKISKTPDTYPRKAGTPEKKPL